LRRARPWLLGLVPLAGLVELGLHQYFARRAPGFQDYAALAPQLLKLKPPGVPVVVAPAWAEPLLRQAAPSAFPLEELARMDDSSFEGFLEVSLLREHAAELRALPVERSWRIGAFSLSFHRNVQREPALFDFVSAVAAAQVEVFSEVAGQREVCPLVAHAHTATGGLHGHVAYPRQRFECPRGGFVGVSIVDDQDHRPRRCVLTSTPALAQLVLRFGGVPASRHLLGFAGFSYFLERDAETPEVLLRGAQDGAALGEKRVTGGAGWSRFELLAPREGSSFELVVRSLTQHPQEACFALEAR
jgi:hypothetical protein